MAKFLFVYRSDKDTFDTMAPEELQMFHQKWRTWIAEGKQKGWMLDASTALKTEGRVVNADKAVSDGPFAEARNVVRGYVNLEADTLDSAAELAKGCPVLLHGGVVEILGPGQPKDLLASLLNGPTVLGGVPEIK